MSPNAFKPEAETAAAATTTLARAAILVLVALSKAGRGAKELGAPGGSVPRGSHLKLRIRDLDVRAKSLEVRRDLEI